MKKAWNYIEYREGDIVGNNGCIFIKEIEQYVSPKGDIKRKAMFQCPKCGNLFYTHIAGIKKGDTRSCGCVHIERARTLNYKHGLRNNKINTVWNNIKDRCYNRNNVDYHSYGGRGITICNTWMHDLKAFYDYVIVLDNYDKHGFTLDRIDNNEGYKPGNVRWTDGHIQAANRRIRSTNKSGYTGVCKLSNRWASYISHNGVKVYLGCYQSIEAAVNARNKYIIDNKLTEYKIQTYV